MKNIFFVIASSLYSHIIFSQGKWHSEFTAIEIIYGQKLYNHDFYGQLNSINKYAQALPPAYIGISFSGGFVLSRSGHSDGHMSYCQLLPQKIFATDSIPVKLTGYIFSWSILPVGGYDLLYNSKNCDILVSCGINVGRIKLSDDPRIKRKNAFLSPKISLEPRVKIWKIVLFIRGDYEYDISRYKWINIGNQNGLFNVDKFNQSGLTVMAGIGIGLD